jgi:hypothetical protein
MHTVQKIQATVTLTYALQKIKYKYGQMHINKLVQR